MTDQVLITGASSGIGEAFARVYARNGNNLILIARRKQKLEALAAELENAYAVKVTCLTVDLSKPDRAQVVFQHLRNEQKTVDVLINNAGYGVPGKFIDNDWATHRDSNQLMVTGVAELTHLLLPDMIANEHGEIFNIASIAGLIPASAGHSLYGAMKAWLIRFSESLHDELAPQNIKVLAVCPGFTYSEFHDVTGTRANVDKLPNIFWMSAEQVAEQSLLALEKNKNPIFIPGSFNRFLVLLVKVLPVFIVRRLIARNAVYARNNV